MKFDQSTELLACVHEQATPVLTTDLDTNRFEMLTAATTTSSLSHVPDGDVISDYEHALRTSYLARFPNIDGMPPKTWVTLLDAGQLARLCRAIGEVERTKARFALRPATEPAMEQPTQTIGTVRWDAEARAQIHQVHCALRDEVFAVRDELRELLAAVWCE